MNTRVAGLGFVFCVFVAACGAPEGPWLLPGRSHVHAEPERPSEPALAASASAPLPLPPRASACSRDADCAYDPASAACDSDPRSNPQATLIDQGVVCYCSESERCATLAVPPVPCEGDESCAVRCDPRPWPVASSREHPYRRETICGDESIRVTCERTNICTLHRKRMRL